MRELDKKSIIAFKKYLEDGERAAATVEKYVRDLKTFCNWLDGRPLNKGGVLNYKAYLSQKYKEASVNSVLSSLNSFFTYMGWHELRVKSLKIQRQLFLPKDKELTKAEYEKLLTAAMQRKDGRLYLLMQTICSTGIRVSELRFITVEAVMRGMAKIDCKGKRRCAFLPTKLCKMLEKYVMEQKIKSGPVFISKNGNPLDRSNIWSSMKKLCRELDISEDKVFPHNLRHLFARTYYSSQKDIVRLADILGHSSVNTTRIYTIESGEIHREQIQQLGLVFCATT